VSELPASRAAQSSKLYGKSVTIKTGSGEATSFSDRLSSLTGVSSCRITRKLRRELSGLLSGRWV